MTLGEKLKQYRTDAGLTQEELADRLFVTRAAVSKWERDLGYPGIDSLKLIAAQMGCTLDELVSDDDVENQKRLDERAARRMYVCAVACFAFAVLFALLAYFLEQPLYLIGAGAFVAAYLVFAFFSRPRWKRLAGNGIYRAVVFVILLVLVLVITVLGLV